MSGQQDIVYGVPEDKPDCGLGKEKTTEHGLRFRPTYIGRNIIIITVDIFEARHVRHTCLFLLE